MGEHIIWRLTNRHEKEQIPTRHERVEKLHGVVEGLLEPTKNSTDVLPPEVQVKIESSGGVVNIVGYRSNDFISQFHDYKSEFPNLSFSALTPTVVNKVELPNGETFTFWDLNPNNPTRDIEVFSTKKPNPKDRLDAQVVKLGPGIKHLFAKGSLVGGVVEETSQQLLDRRIREIGLDPDATRPATDEEIASLTALLEPLAV